jgi:hypothetical protein
MPTMLLPDVLKIIVDKIAEDLGLADGGESGHVQLYFSRADLFRCLAAVSSFITPRLTALDLDHPKLDHWNVTAGTHEQKVLAQRVLQQITHLNLSSSWNGYMEVICGFMETFPSLIRYSSTLSVTVVREGVDLMPNRSSLLRLTSWSWKQSGTFKDLTSGIPWLRASASVDSLKELRTEIDGPLHFHLLAQFLRTAKCLELLEITALLEPQVVSALDGLLASETVHTLILRWRANYTASFATLISHINMPNVTSIHIEIDVVTCGDRSLNKPSATHFAQASQISEMFPKVEKVVINICGGLGSLTGQPSTSSRLSAYVSGIQAAFEDVRRCGADVHVVMRKHNMLEWTF